MTTTATYRSTGGPGKGSMIGRRSAGDWQKFATLRSLYSLTLTRPPHSILAFQRSADERPAA